MNWLDVIIILVLVGGVFSGFKNGFVGELASLAGLVLGIWGAVKFSWWTSDLFESFGLSFSLMPVVAFIVTFLAIAIIMQVLGGAVSSLLKSISLNWINRIAGMVAGLTKAAIFASVILLVIDALDERQRIIREDTKETSLLFEPVSEIVPTLLPFVMIEDLKKAAAGEEPSNQG